MYSIEAEYFREYKTVENICKDMYGADGVKAYIETMHNCSSKEKILVNDWDKRLKTLKHLKWLRNQIAHENDSYEVTEQDLADIRKFHNELLNQQDPLALLYKEIEKAKKKQRELKLQQKKSQISTQKPSYIDSPNYNDDEYNNSKIIAIALVAVAVIVIVAIAFLFFK